MLTVMVTEYVPAAVGVPEMTFRFEPLPCFTPGGSVPVTVKVVGLLVAVIV